MTGSQPALQIKTWDSKCKEGYTGFMCAECAPDMVTVVNRHVSDVTRLGGLGCVW